MAADANDVQKLGKLIKGINYAMLTTAAEDGSLRSRPMATQMNEFDGTLWFFTDADSGKVFEVRQDSHVNVAYADPSANTYVSVSGRASISRDKAKIKELWNAGVKAWFPDGPEDPKIALIKVDVQHAEYWDNPHGAIVQTLAFVKATLTGQRLNPGEHGTVNMK